MAIIVPARFVSTMQRNTVILEGILSRVTQEQATARQANSDEWTVAEIVCHLRDLEQVFYNRALRVLKEDRPTFELLDNRKMALESGYNSQNMYNAFRAYLNSRHKLIELFNGLTRDEWSRTGIHPRYGVMTMLDLAAHVTTHDIEHIEQIVRTLALPTST